MHFCQSGWGSLKAIHILTVFFAYLIQYITAFLVQSLGGMLSFRIAINLERRKWRAAEFIV